MQQVFLDIYTDMYYDLLHPIIIKNKFYRKISAQMFILNYTLMFIPNYTFTLSPVICFYEEE